MNYLDVYNLQIEFYNDVSLAWKSLNENAKRYIIEHYPHLLPNINKARRKYFLKCWRITEDNKFCIPNINKRKFKEFDIDHIVPIYYGFKHNISPSLIASIENLRIIPHRENFEKHIKLTEEGKQLLHQWKINTF